MGKFMHPEGSVTIDDRTLAHLQFVIATKLRRHESFLFTWHEDVSLGSGRISVWLTPGQPIAFRFDGRRHGTVNPAWIDALATAANSAAGLQLVAEPAPNSSEAAEADV